MGVRVYYVTNKERIMKRRYIILFSCIMLFTSSCSIYKDMGTISTTYTDPSGAQHMLVSTHRCIATIKTEDTEIVIEYEESSIWMNIFIWGGSALSAVIAATLL